MASIISTKRVKNGTTTVSDTIYTYETLANPTLTDTDLNLFKINGEVVVDFGGEIKDAGNATVAILPPNNRKIPSQLAFSQAFPASQYPNAQAVRDAYGATIQARLKAGIDALRARTTANDNSNSWTY